MIVEHGGVAIPSHTWHCTILVYIFGDVPIEKGNSLGTTNQIPFLLGLYKIINH